MTEHGQAHVRQCFHKSDPAAVAAAPPVSHPLNGLSFPSAAQRAGELNR
jgi:hypothetical protein